MQPAFPTKDVYDRSFEPGSSTTRFITVPLSSDGTWEIKHEAAWIDTAFGPITVGSLVALRSKWCTAARFGIIIGFVDCPVRMCVLAGPWHDDHMQKEGT